MKHKVKKFGRGGDILTALGAGLAGYGAYKYFTKDKGESKDDDYTRRVKEFGRKGDFPEAKKEEKADAKKAEAKVADDRDEARERALRQSKDPKSNLVPEGADKDKLYESDKALVRTDDRRGPPAAKKSANRNQPKKASSANLGFGETTPKPTIKEIGTSTFPGQNQTPEQAAVDKKAAERQKFLQSKAGLSGKGITTPGDPNAKGSTQKGRSANPIQETIDSRGKDMARTPQQKMAEGAREVERRRQAEKKKKDDEANMKGALKKGGAVKKYASGGSVSSASKRADGIAIRGKTRA
jgi:hypothetical protein